MWSGSACELCLAYLVWTFIAHYDDVAALEDEFEDEQEKRGEADAGHAGHAGHHDDDDDYDDDGGDGDGDGRVGDDCLRLDYSCEMQFESPSPFSSAPTKARN